jgi:hypothetical protein
MNTYPHVLVITDEVLDLHLFLPTEQKKKITMYTAPATFGAAITDIWHARLGTKDPVVFRVHGVKVRRLLERAHVRWEPDDEIPKRAEWVEVYTITDRGTIVTSIELSDRDDE